MTEKRTTILFLCTGNSCRSQMAEGFAHANWPDQYQAVSAGIEKHGMNPSAMQVMAEAGAEISSQHSKTLDEIDIHAIDYVVTVCDHASETCPMFPGNATIIHQGFEDPPKLAAGLEGEQALDCYRQVRDQIQGFVKDLPARLSH